MAVDLELFLIGLSHRTAPVEVRERCAIDAADLPRRLGALMQLEGVAEGWIVSTCNRTEVLVAAPIEPALENAVRELIFQGADGGQLYVYRGVQAVIHLFRVSAGLDSMILGESQILSQVKQSTEGARAAGTLGALLNPLLQQALSVGKRVRTETAVGQGTLSVARMGVEIASRVLGRFDGHTALLVGAGETARLVGRHLADGGAGQLLFANRTAETALEVARELGGEGHTLDALPQLVVRADLIATCVEGAAELLRAEHFPPRHLAHRDRPLVVLDLSVPRAVDGALARTDNLLYYDLDDLGRFVAENQRERERAVEGTSELLVAEVHKFLGLRTYAAFSPAIAALRERFEAAREEVLDARAGGPSGAGELELAHELTKRLLDIALDQLKEGARRARPEEALDKAYQRFLENL